MNPKMWLAIALATCMGLTVGLCAAVPQSAALPAGAGAPRQEPPSKSASGGDQKAPPNLLIIGASSLNSPVPLTQLVGAMLESTGIPMHIEGGWPDLAAVGKQLSAKPTWDYVIMDAWHFGRGRTDADFSTAVAAFVKEVRAHSPKCKIILFPWWIPNGPKATNEGVMEVFQRCVEEAKANDLWVATTGPAFMGARLDRPDLQVTKSKTDAHPGVHGAYINSCSLFAILTDQTPVGLPAKLSLTAGGGKKTELAVAPEEARYLQELAWKVYQRESKHTKPAK